MPETAEVSKPTLLCMTVNPIASGTHIGVARENSDGVRVYTLLKASDLSKVVETTERRVFNAKVQDVVDDLSQAIAKASRTAADKELDDALNGQ